MLSALGFFAQTQPPPAACGPPAQAGVVCESLFRLTGNETVARAGDLFVVRPAKIGVVVAVALLGSRLLRSAIGRFVSGLGDDGRHGSGHLASARARQRADTIGALLSSISSFAVWTIAVLMVLGELGLQLGPLIAGAGIVGIALGFGAQNLVRDFLSGIFMLIEDQYGVGDVIDAGPATGKVEGVSLRTTRLRDVEGNVWHIPNGQIERVANKSQEWSRALLDIPLSYDVDTVLAAKVIKGAADSMWRDPAWAPVILAEPEVWGVEELGPDGILIRLVVKTSPLSQWTVARELRAAVKAGLEAECIEISSPQRVVWHRGEPVGADSNSAD
ncbi:MAG: mechanosensitive ion channel family protein [Acidimicrobiales bacterium]